LVYGAYYELFVSVPGVHIPRVTISENTWGKTVVNFTMNVPTVTHFIVLVVGLLSVCFSFVIYVIHFGSLKIKTMKYWKVMITGFAICLIAEFIAVVDFFGSALDGVG
jgi:sensor histidine kinase YesM